MAAPAYKKSLKTFIKAITVVDELEWLLDSINTNEYIYGLFIHFNSATGIQFKINKIKKSLDGNELIADIPVKVKLSEVVYDKSICGKLPNGVIKEIKKTYVSLVNDLSKNKN